jgi:lipooligosaccharide transport system ATP-binding protein
MSFLRAPLFRFSNRTVCAIIGKMNAPVVTAEHVFKSYRTVQAVSDLSFEVHGPGCFGFLGPNGAGKTTMMKILYGKATADLHPSTRISVFGFDPAKDQLRIKTLSGVAPQDDNLDLELNVLQNLRIFARFYGLQGKRENRRIDELLEFMELKEKRTARVRELSGGMKRRLIIARALLNDPRLLILDEPTTGLDPQVRQLIWDKLRQLIRGGVTILLTTHYMEEAYQIADSIIIMDKGRKVMEGDPRKLLETGIEKHVLELTVPGVSGKIPATDSNTPVRLDDSGERYLYYSADPELLKRMATHLAPGEFLIRQSNLEDLFIQATGRRLNELQ